MKFREFLAEFLVKDVGEFFCKALPTTETMNYIINAFPVTVEDPHVTLMFSKTPIDKLDIPEFPRETRFVAKPLSYEWWPGSDGEGFLVLKLESAGFKWAHNTLKEAGLVPTHPEYNAHMTLQTPVTRESVQHYLNQLPPQDLLTFYYGGYVIRKGE